jgi:hypothetical protein
MGRGRGRRRAYLELNFAPLLFARALLVTLNPNLDKGTKRNVSHSMYAIGNIGNLYRVQRE